MPVHDPLRRTGAHTVVAESEINDKADAKTTKDDDGDSAPEATESCSILGDGLAFVR